MRSNLERRYRALLRVLPRWYRAEREEEMVGLFLTDRDDGLDREHGWPGWGEAVATAGLAVRVRFRPRSRAGDVTRLVALAGLVGHLVLSAQSAVSTSRSGDVPVLWYDALLVAVFAAVVTGRLGWARWLVLVVLVVATLPLTDPGVAWWAAATVLPMWVTAAAVWLGLHSEAPRVPQARWVGAAVAGVLVGAATAFVVPLSLVTWAAVWLTTTAVVVVFRPWVAVPEETSSA
ncbi:hypothetical protein ABZ816_04815 [Actinosynnema sp. NPDC047251]|uniref:Putative membrane protein n=1 Tax=Saccharothrix espanaensis (strain ATCC 51144 / DSM 44229 / JCM 9112 / NBRC 15066 / NRRL 15764) TaxID=1179773 RepID=K0JUT2_SACES|nr:hypothetical protein [Saccharothrix espanaensis]CCH31585.1 putative membrane protein [Saccharothrix espanaensis DSM 44229]